MLDYQILVQQAALLLEQVLVQVLVAQTVEEQVLPVVVEALQVHRREQIDMTELVVAAVVVRLVPEVAQVLDPAQVAVGLTDRLDYSVA